MTRAATVRQGDILRVVRAYAKAGVRTRAIVRPGEVIVEAVDAKEVPASSEGGALWDRLIDRHASS